MERDTRGKIRVKNEQFFFLEMKVCRIHGEFEISISSVSKISFLLGASSSGGADGSFGCSKPKQNSK